MRKCIILLAVLLLSTSTAHSAEEEALKAISLDKGNFPNLRAICEGGSSGQAFKDFQKVLGHQLGVSGSTIVCSIKDEKPILKFEENSESNDEQIVKMTRALDALYKPINEENQPIWKPLASCVDKISSVDGKDDPNCKNQMEILKKLSGSSKMIIDYTRLVLNDCNDAAEICPEGGDTKQQFVNLKEVSSSLSALGHDTSQFPNCIDLKNRLTEKLNAQDAEKAKKEAEKLAAKKKAADVAKKKKAAQSKKTTSALSSLMSQLKSTVNQMSKRRENSNFTPPGGGSVQSDYVPQPIPPDMPPNFSGQGTMLLQNEDFLTLWHKRGYRFAGQHRIQQILRSDLEIRGKISDNLAARGIPASMSNMVHYIQELTSGE